MIKNKTIIDLMMFQNPKCFGIGSFAVKLWVNHKF